MSPMEIACGAGDTPHAEQAVEVAAIIGEVTRRIEPLHLRSRALIRAGWISLFSKDGSENEMLGAWIRRAFVLQVAYFLVVIVIIVIMIVTTHHVFHGLLVSAAESIAVGLTLLG